MNNKILILENEESIPDQLAHYIDQYDLDTTIINDLDNQDSDIIKNSIDTHDKILMQSTLSDKTQFGIFIHLFAHFGGKEIYILSTGEKLHYKLHQYKSDYDRAIKKAFRKSNIYEICYITKDDPKNSSTFFKSYQYFFDTRKLYHNKDYDEIFPERPICWSEDELKHVYKYRPKWIENDSYRDK